MSELRLDPLTGEAVLVAPGRRGIGVSRPGGLPPLGPRGCPFCPGAEAETEEALLTVGDPWQLRVVRNRYPLVAPDRASARGVHEVLVESRVHDGDLATYDDAHAARVVRALRDRARALEAVPGIAALAVFRNHGRRAGSSQPHPHCQLVALDRVPPETARRHAVASADPDVLRRAVDAERRAGLRWLGAHEGWAAHCPAASHRAWETRLTREDGASTRLSALDDEAADALGRALAEVARRLRAVLGPHDANVLFREPPLGAVGPFVVDVLPRTGGDAGFELGTGIDVCVVAPEEAAAALRAAEVRRPEEAAGAEAPEP